jgi:hypothetical protein
MGDNRRPKTADWAPGTLEETRKAIGDIAPEEAKMMSKKLGGEVMYERSEPETMVIPAKSSRAGRIVRQNAAESVKKSSAEPTAIEHSRRRAQDELPVISQKFDAQIDKLMMSDEYKIKPNYGLFNFIKKFQKGGNEQLIPEFCTFTLKQHVESIQAFITVIKTMIQIAPASYKTKIASGIETKFKFLRMIAGWQLQTLRLALIDVQDSEPPYLVSDLIPFTQAMYRLLIQVYYYGENKIPKLIKEIYADESKYPEAPREKLSELAKQAITDWLYIQNEIIKRHYPLLMRMCSAVYADYPDFFKSRVSDILRFVELHKYDLLLPEKPKEEEAVPAKKESPPEIGAHDKIVDTGIVLLDRLFPQAGFKNLEKHPDLFPYFQPMYKFLDGFNVLSPENALQVVVVLLRILEDCFQGCRNIKFTQNNFDSKTSGTDSILSVIDSWTGYRETVFEKLYCDPLNNLVNQIYSQKDFEKTQFGKKLMTSLLWQTNYHFLPHFKFEQLLLEHPADESKMPPLFRRTDFARKFLMHVVSQCDKAAKERGIVESIANPWDHYTFEIPNEMSKRLDVFLGGQNTGETTGANNANLLKYTLCILSVLDWWINNAESPAYSSAPMRIYRISTEDGKPQFSVPQRSDQNKLFADAVRAAYKK